MNGANGIKISTQTPSKRAIEALFSASAAAKI
jgi:hypothetical protein